MSHKTNASPSTAWWAKRRVLISALGLVALVGSGAAAQASSHGDGFLKLGFGNTSSSGGYFCTTKTLSGTTQGTTHTNTNVSSMWTWSGTGINRYAFRILGNQADPTFNQLLGINDRGLIVGYYGSGEDAMHPNKGYWVNSPYSSTNFRDGNFPGSVQTQLIGVNASGQSVGFYVDAAGANHGFLRDTSGRYSTVDFPGTTSSPAVNQLLGINNSGIATGFWNDKAGNSQGYLYNIRTGQFILIKLPVKVTSVIVTGVNNNGQAVGFFTVGKITHAFLWNKGAFRVLNLGNASNTQALGINDAGIVVGSFVDTAGHTRGFVRSNAHLRVVDAPGSSSTVVNGLNNKGQIVGFFTDKNKHTLGFLAHS
jgi:probable HAF family extracellular repeat protein